MFTAAVTRGTCAARGRLPLPVRCGGVPSAVSRVAPSRCATRPVVSSHASRVGLRWISSRHSAEVTASGQDIVDLYDQSVSEYLRLAGTPFDHLTEAVKRDPEFCLGHSVMALFQLLSNVPATNPDVQACVAAAKKLVDSGKANEREKRYTAAALSWCADDVRGTTAQLEALLLDNPYDSLTIRLLHDTYFMLGDQFNLRHSVGRVVPRWTPDVPDYPRILGMYTFGLEENNAFAEAEEFGMRTLHVDPSDTWAVHAMVHVFEMQGRRNEGLRLMREMRDDWGSSGMLLCHMQWHWGLFQLDEGDVDMAFSRHDVELRGDDSPFLNNLCDAIGLLWRFELYGCNVEQRWTDILDKVKVYMHDHAFGFNEPFISMCLIGAGDVEAAEAHLQSMREYAASSPSAEVIKELQTGIAGAALSPSHTFTAAPWAFVPERGALDNRGVTAAAALPVCEGLVAYRQGAYEEAVEKLLPTRPLHSLLGGSNAQRDVIELTLLQAAMQSGNHKLAVALLSERTAKRTSQPVVWWWLAESLEAAGDSAGAAEARDRAYSLGLNQGGSHAQ